MCPRRPWTTYNDTPWFGGPEATGDAYEFNNGTIDARLSSGGVTAFLGSVADTLTFLGGTGNDVADVRDFSFMRIDFSAGGSDAVVWQESRFNEDLPINPADAGFEYNRVVGFSDND